METPDLELRAAEGRPSSLVLELAGPLQDAQSVELWRSVDGQEPVSLEVVQFDDATRASVGNQVAIIDRSPVTGDLTYLALLRTKQSTAQAQATIRWAEAAASPNLTGTVEGASVTLRWTGLPQDGCLVFRRDILTEERASLLAKIIPRHEEFVDTNVVPSGVYVYRVSTIDNSAGYPRYSDPSDELYVTVPEAMP